MSWDTAANSIPKGSSGNYYKFQDGANKFRILSEPIQGYLYWTVDNKPSRSQEFPENPKNIREDSKVKFFWAFTVWSYRDNKVQILELTQSSIQRAIADLINSEDWGSPKEYDLTVTRKGEKLDTEYTVQPSPQKAVPAEALKSLKERPVNLKALFTNGDPFDASEVANLEKSEEDFDNIPF